MVSDVVFLVLVHVRSYFTLFVAILAHPLFGETLIQGDVIYMYYTLSHSVCGTVTGKSSVT